MAGRFDLAGVGPGDPELMTIKTIRAMTITPAIRNMIRDNKVPQIDGIVYSSNKEEMHSMDFDLLNLYKDGRITAETALSYASNPEMLKKKL